MLNFVERAKRVKLIILDVDGVLSDGKIIFSPSGELAKSFNCKDGLGISLLQKFGVKTAIITGRNSEIVRHRAEELKIHDVYQGAMNKLTAFEELCAKYHLTHDEIAYVGDDLIDLPVMCQVGLACAVQDAVTEVKTRAHYITRACGGQGGVREVAELILKAQDKWDAVVQSYINQKPLTKVGQ